MTTRKLLVHLRVILCELRRMFPQPGIQIHGGGLEWQGAGVMLTGPSCRGKSTLVQLLVCSEFRFVQDQRIGVTADDQLRGNGFPGWLRSAGFAAWRAELVRSRLDADRWVWTRTFNEHHWVLPPAELRSRGKVPLRLIVEVQFTPGASVRLETLNAEAIAGLLHGELRDTRMKARAKVDDISARVPGVRLTYGRAEQHPEIAAALKARL